MVHVQVFLSKNIISLLNNYKHNKTYNQANCRAFADTTGYEPSGEKNAWERLQEDNGLGFFYSYDHVTPHIVNSFIFCSNFCSL